MYCGGWLAYFRPPKQEFGEALLACEHSDNPGETSIPTQGNQLGEWTVLRNKDSEFWWDPSNKAILAGLIETQQQLKDL